MEGSNDNARCSNGTEQHGRTAEEQSNTPLSVAIVGGGIVGVILALGLLNRGIQVNVYERAPNFHEIGAGFAFTTVARKCMEQLNPAIFESMKRVGIPNTKPFDEYWDGYHYRQHVDEEARFNQDVSRVGDPEGNSTTLLFKRDNRLLAYWGCLRARFLDDLSRALPPGVVHFNKEFVEYSDSAASMSAEPIILRFRDGSRSSADALIGCDGLHSRVRAQLLASDAPLATSATYTHKRCYRAIVPRIDGEKALGIAKANDQCMHVGPGAHILTYPVGVQMLNIVMFIADQDDWPDAEHTTMLGRREDVLRRLQDWGPAARGLAALLPEEPLVWGIFDMYDHPAPYFSKGRVCLVGDAAHASAPHHGAGAGFGVEDALALATSMEEVLKSLKNHENESIKRRAIEAALQSYNRIRYNRAQWLVRSSRETGDIYEWMYPETGSDPIKCQKELEERFATIAKFSIQEMVDDTRKTYEHIMFASGNI